MARILDGLILVSFTFSNISGKPLAEAGREIGYGTSFIEWFRCFESVGTFSRNMIIGFNLYIYLSVRRHAELEAR